MLHVFIGEILANMTQVSDVAPGPLVCECDFSDMAGYNLRIFGMMVGVYIRFLYIVDFFKNSLPVRRYHRFSFFKN
jgi:hypothetical protein